MCGRFVCERTREDTRFWRDKRHGTAAGQQIPGHDRYTTLYYFKECADEHMCLSKIIGGRIDDVTAGFFCRNVIVVEMLLGFLLQYSLDDMVWHSHCRYPRIIGEPTTRAHFKHSSRASSCSLVPEMLGA